MIDYLRISILDGCNLNCFYCNPYREDYRLSEEILTKEEIVKIVKVFSELGIKGVRITGGEPLFRKDVLEIIKEISENTLIEDISLTTNGIFLKEKVELLKKAGLRRINISLDTLKRERFLRITGKDKFFDVIEGIKKAVSIFENVKINAVVFKGINDDEIIDFIEFFKDKNISLRFIEYVATSLKFKKFEEISLTSDEIKRIIEKKFGKLEKDTSIYGKGPAKYFSLPNLKLKIGFISGKTHNFCSTCNRIRVSSSGKVYECLYSKKFLDLKKLLNNEGKLKEEIRKLLSRKKSFKGEREYNNFYMVKIGG